MRDRAVKREEQRETDVGSASSRRETGVLEARLWQYCHVLSLAVLHTVRRQDVGLPEQAPRTLSLRSKRRQDVDLPKHAPRAAVP